jgi:prepilin-type N-terminal cleavage/methylation domain-containing protein
LDFNLEGAVKMKTPRMSSQARKAFRGRSRGFTLVEVVIAIALLGIISVAVLGALSYASTILIIADRRATAESLAKSQMEYVKNNDKSPYDDDVTHNPPQYVGDSSIIPANYNVAITAVRLDPKGDGTINDDGIQQITVTVSYNILRYDVTSQKSTLVGQNFTLEDYKREPVT